MSAAVSAVPVAERFRVWIREALAGLEFKKRRVAFLLGTDEFIDRERRVALTPKHVRKLRQDLVALGLTPRIYVVRGAGARAEDERGEGFADDLYAAHGAEPVTVAETAGLGPLDVVHALKEPTDYEAELEGPLLRIGALHLASKPRGLCRMLERRNFAAILDGGTVGNCSYREHGGDRTPIVASMSRFAGAVSGRKVDEYLRGAGPGRGKLIVVGGGIAGTSAIEKLRRVADPLVVVESYAPTRRRLAATLPALGFRDARIVERLDDTLLEDAVGIVFAHRSGAKAAEKVCDYRQIRRMRRGAAIADIAIDQGGSINHDGYCETDDAPTSRDKYARLLAPEFFYYAETNMPREEPRLASEVHGDAALPYVVALLALSAYHGGPLEAAGRMLANEIRVFDPSSEVVGGNIMNCIIQDLRNGVQLATVDGEIAITDPDIERDAGLVGWIRGCAAGSEGPG